MALRHRIKRIEVKAAARPRACPHCVGPSVVHFIPAPVISRVGELPWVESEPTDWCRCGRRVVHRMPPPERARAGAGAA